MKTTTLLAAILMVTGTATANTDVAFTAPRGHVLFSNDHPIEFTERGMHFMVFPNGEFDFSTQPSTSGDYYRGNRGNTHGATAHFGGIRVAHDAQGRVRRVGNVYINYDAFNRVKRIGTVYMTYHRDRLTQIGGLRLVYDRRGRLTDMIGRVKNTAVAYAPYYGPANGWSGNYYYRNDEKNN